MMYTNSKDPHICDNRNRSGPVAVSQQCKRNRDKQQMGLLLAQNEPWL